MYIKSHQYDDRLVFAQDKGGDLVGAPDVRMQRALINICVLLWSSITRDDVRWGRLGHPVDDCPGLLSHAQICVKRMGHLSVHT